MSARHPVAPPAGTPCAPTPGAGGRLAATLLAMTLAGGALAHAYLSTSSPARFESVDAVDVIDLSFTMDVEVLFSQFELRRLTLPETAWPADPTAPTEEERMRLKALVAQQLRADDPDAIIDVTIEPTRRTLDVMLTPAAPLEPGAYAVAFEVLAVDGHTTSEHLIFFVTD